MGLEAKVGLMGQIERRIGADVTAEAMPRILSAMADVLEGFEVTETRRKEAGEDDLLGYYFRTMELEGRSPQTVARYRYIMGRVMESLGVGCRQVTVYHLRGYLAAEQVRGLKDTTLEGVRQVISACFGWLWRENLIERNPAANLSPIKCAKLKKAAYSAADLERIHQASAGSLRDRTIIAFLEGTGCRIGEMVGLNRDAVDLDRLECVVHGKGNKERTVWLSEVAGMLLREYLAGRKDDDPALFANRCGERLQPGGVRKMLRKVGAMAGVENVHPHRFRRTLATSMNRRGMPVQQVAAVLGHEKLDTTMKYVVMDNEDLRSGYRRYAS